MNGGRLIAVNKSRYFQKNSELTLGTGAFVAGLEFSSGKTAEVVGKPSKEFFKLGKTLHKKSLKNVILISLKPVQDFPRIFPWTRSWWLVTTWETTLSVSWDNINFSDLVCYQASPRRRPGGWPARRPRDDGEIQTWGRGLLSHQARLCVQRPDGDGKSDPGIKRKTENMTAIPILSVEYM